ncbi:MAG: EamA family transporter [Pseudomonadota bacterium]|nr:EamA family transporter [Pseudomonadota bacterium]MEA3240606.1 EamA family transporter [Pseudomonadota bacterium]
MKIWLILSLLTAFFASLKDVFSKTALDSATTYLIAWFWSVGTLPFLLPFLLIIEIPAVNKQFWLALVAGGLLHVAATILYIKAIRSSDLSITIPMITFTPLFLLLTSPLMTGEFPAPITIIGIVMIVAGSYLLNINDIKEGVGAPFRALFREPGPRMMLAVAVIWSITANIDKIGITCTSPVFWLIAIESVVAVAMFPFVWLTTPDNGKIMTIKQLKILLPIGLCAALVLLFQMYAISLVQVPYVIAIKRSSVLISVGFGYLLFGEKKIRQRSIGAACMCAGVVIIAVFS